MFIITIPQFWPDMIIFHCFQSVEIHSRIEMIFEKSCQSIVWWQEFLILSISETQIENSILDPSPMFHVLLWHTKFQLVNNHILHGNKGQWACASSIISAIIFTFSFQNWSLLPACNFFVHIFVYQFGVYLFHSFIHCKCRTWLRNRDHFFVERQNPIHSCSYRFAFIKNHIFHPLYHHHRVSLGANTANVACLWSSTLSSRLSYPQFMCVCVCRSLSFSPFASVCNVSFHSRIKIELCRAILLSSYLSIVSLFFNCLSKKSVRHSVFLLAIFSTSEHKYGTRLFIIRRQSPSCYPIDTPFLPSSTLSAP